MGVGDRDEEFCEIIRVEFIVCAVIWLCKGEFDVDASQVDLLALTEWIIRCNRDFLTVEISFLMSRKREQYTLSPTDPIHVGIDSSQLRQVQIQRRNCRVREIVEDAYYTLKTNISSTMT